MSGQQSKSNARTYAPRGVVSERPIAVRLTPDERKAFAALAEAENLSDGAMGRVLILRGMASDGGEA